MQSLIINEVRRYLHALSDQELLGFFARHILPELSPSQLQQLQELVNQKAGMTGYFARIDGDAFLQMAQQLDLDTIYKLRGVLDEAEAQRQRNPIVRQRWY